MKKIVMPIIILMILMIGLYFSLLTVHRSKPHSEKSKEELYQDILISCLMPYIQNEVDKYYSKYLTEPPMAAPYTVFVMSAERPNGYRTFFFRLKLQVNSYTGPHISVGLDHLTVTVNGSGDVGIEKFEHIKSYELPARYVDMIKKEYRNPIP